MKICISGGTFDPIHKGHIEIAKIALSQFNLDKVIFMPTGNSYMKSDVTVSDHGNAEEAIRAFILDGKEGNNE